MLSALLRLYTCAVVRSFSTVNSRVVPKHKYDSTDIFLEKAKVHLNSGDVAQCCEKLFGSVKLALRLYVDRLGAEHGFQKIDPEKFDYSKYRSICTVIAKSMKNKSEKNAFSSGWRSAEQLHVQGWCLNSIEYEDAENGIEEVEDYLLRIATLSTDCQLAEKVYKQIFGFDEIAIAESIGKNISKNNYEQALRHFGVKLEYDREERGRIAAAYKALYGDDLRTKLEVAKML